MAASEEERETVEKKGDLVVVTTHEEDDENDTKESVLQKYFLLEWKLVKSLMDRIVSDSTVSHLSDIHKIREIMEKYQEQGQLLEPYLEIMVSPLMFIIRSKTIEQGLSSLEILEIIQPLCIIIYSLVTVCGYKAVIKFFPHQVSDLELAVSLLEKCHGTHAVTAMRHESTGEMETQCVILLWLSILVLVPFDISSVDTSIANSNSLDKFEPAPLVLRILGFSKDYLSNAGRMRTMAGLLLSKLLTRPDMPIAFTSFIEWTHDVMSSDNGDFVDQFRILGAVEALASIFKTGSRQLLVDVVPIIWNDSSELIKSNTAVRSPLLRKYLVKLSQRIGFTCLPHRSPSWRYVGKSNSLGASIVQNTSDEVYQSNNDVDVDAYRSEKNIYCQEDEEDMDVPEIVEEIMEMLLSGLRDTDTVVRWSAAKGIGRITSRLTSVLADEVLSSVLDLFSPGEGDGSWHGGCLALAELARRGLLLPVSLPKVVPFVVKALHYDIRRGPHSIGSHVRDAAAYVCWAFGRAYFHSDLRNVLELLAPHLLTVACYDREVNCRRAAAAAFQENVGRQGNYPHGIDIVNAADYFSLSSRINSFLNVAVGIAQYEGYLFPFVDELLHSKICHWDKGVRELAARSLSALVKYDCAYIANFVLEKLIPYSLSTDLCTRHGATLAAGEVVLALHKCNYTLSIDKQKNVASVVPAIEKARLYRGKGGEIMRSAVSRFIECISLARIVIPEKIKRSLQDTLNENLRHPNSQIQNTAVEALKHFILEHLPSANIEASSDITFKYLEQLTHSNVAVRRGSALAIGVLPYEFLENTWKLVLPKLCRCCEIEDNPEDRDAEARVNAVKALVSVCKTLSHARQYSQGFSEDDEPLLLIIKNDVMTSLFKALDDYSVDNRGDVGSWVREVAMDGLEQCTYILCKGNFTMLSSNIVESKQIQSFLDEILVTRLIGGIVKQAVEKMDKLREVAAKILRRILYNETIFVPFILYKEKLQEIIPEDADLKWGVPSFSYPRFVQLLEFSGYSKYVLSGLVISVGGLQDSLRKTSLSSLLEYLEATAAEDKTESDSKDLMLYTDILWVLQQYKRCDRVILPTLKTIEILFSKRIFLNLEGHTSICAGILDSLSVELKGSKDFSKLYTGIAILGYIASVSEPINTRAFSHLLTFLAHRYPKIRKACSEQVYLVLLQNENLIAEDKIEKAVEIISETCWEGDIEVAKRQKIQIYEIAGLEIGQLVKPCKVVSKDGDQRLFTADENASYSSLVESSGF